MGGCGGGALEITEKPLDEKLSSSGPALPRGAGNSRKSPSRDTASCHCLIGA